MSKPDNLYLRIIAEKTGTISEKHRPNNWYLKYIAENIGGGGGGGDITVDSQLSTTSKNPVQNKVITNALNGKADDSDIPTKTSDLTNDSGFLTQHQDVSGKANISDLSNVAFSGSYTDLIDTPNLEIIKVTSDKGTASEQTMNKLFIEIDGNTADAYYTVRENNVYVWKKFDEDILDDLSISWNDLTDKPTIPSKISDLTDDSDFVEESDLSTVATSGSYNDLSNKPSIPSDIDDLGLDTVTMTVTYTDDSTEDLEVVIVPNGE